MKDRLVYFEGTDGYVYVICKVTTRSRIGWLDHSSCCAIFEGCFGMDGLPQRIVMMFELLIAGIWSIMLVIVTIVKITCPSGNGSFLPDFPYPAQSSISPSILSCEQKDVKQKTRQSQVFDFDAKPML